MRTLFPLREALDDPHILGGLLDGPSWAHWRALLIGAMGEPLDDEERALFQAITGRPAEPVHRVEELWAIVGRRGGKTRALSLLAAYVSACCDWSDVLAPGETGILALFAATTRQAEIALSYISAIFGDKARPLFHRMRANETQETVELHNSVTIEVRPASFKTSRGISAVGIICDEIAFWSSGDNAANPDTEILNALRPSLATTGGPLIAISSPHARKGELWSTYADHFGPHGDPAVLVVQAPSLVMNPTLPLKVVERAMAKDASAARAEYGAEFRTDVENFVSLDVVERAVVPGLALRQPDILSCRYFGFLDAAGGSGGTNGDAMTMAIAHADGERVVLDRVEEVRPPFSPDDVVAQFASVFQTYRVSTVLADKWGAQWVASPFRRHGIAIDDTADAKSAIYLRLIPLLNSGRVALLDNDRLLSQLVGLERRSVAGGREIIDHPRGGHDDVINAAAGAIVMAGAKLDSFDWEANGEALSHGFNMLIGQLLQH